MRTRSLRWSFCFTARTGKNRNFKATAPKGAAARCTEGRTDFGGGYFIALPEGGEKLRKLKKYTPTRFMEKTSHYDVDAADYAVMFIESLCHTKGTWARKPLRAY